MWAFLLLGSVLFPANDFVCVAVMLPNLSYRVLLEFWFLVHIKCLYCTLIMCRSYGEISLSLCGGLTNADGKISTPSEDSFLQGLITYNDLLQNPKLVENPDLVVRFNGQHYCWRAVCPLIMSLVVYQKPLPQVPLNVTDF